MSNRLQQNREPKWRQVSSMRWQLPKRLKPWLLERGSLTRELMRESSGEFSVQVLSQAVARVYPSEARLLGLKCGRQALVREVILSGMGKPWVFARSVLPLTTLTGRLRALRKLDNKPLGHHLFSYSNMHRGAIEVAKVGSLDHYLPKSMVSVAPSHGLWARRSLFYLDAKPLLVSEVFLPSFNPIKF